MVCSDRNGLVLDVAGVLNVLNTKVRSLNAHSVPGGDAMVFISMEVKDLEALKVIISRLRMIRGVREIHRGNG